LVVANEYFTPAEMEAQNKFKKTSRKARKIRKKEKVTADDLIGLEENTTEDLGSRYIFFSLVCRHEEHNAILYPNSLSGNVVNVVLLLFYEDF